MSHGKDVSALELQTKVMLRFAKISQSQRRRQLGAFSVIVKLIVSPGTFV